MKTNEQLAEIDRSWLELVDKWYQYKADREYERKQNVWWRRVLRWIKMTNLR
jgi:hypothetical protein